MGKQKNQVEQPGQAVPKKSRKFRKFFKWLNLLLFIILLILLFLLFWPYKKSTGTNCQNLVNEVEENGKPSTLEPDPGLLNVGGETENLNSVVDGVDILPIQGDEPSGSTLEEITNLENQQPDQVAVLPQIPQTNPSNSQLQNSGGGTSWGDLTNPGAIINPYNPFLKAPGRQLINPPQRIVEHVENSRHRPPPPRESPQEHPTNQRLTSNLPGTSGREENEETETVAPSNSETTDLPEAVDLVNPGETSRQKKKRRGKQKKKKQPQIEPFEPVPDEVGNRSYMIGFFDNRPHYHAARIGETYGGNGEITAVIFNVTWEGSAFHVKLTPDKSNYYWHIKSYEVYEGHKVGTFYWNDKSIKGVVDGQVRAETDPIKIKTQIFEPEAIHRPGKTKIGHAKYTEEIAEAWKAGVRESRKENREEVLRSLKIYLTGRTGASVVGS